MSLIGRSSRQSLRRLGHIADRGLLGRQTFHVGQVSKSHPQLWVDPQRVMRHSCAYEQCLKSIGNLREPRYSYSANTIKDYIRGHSSSSAAAPDDSSRNAEKQEDATSDSNEPPRSHYWGIAPKTFTREDGSPWPWNCFRPGESQMTDVEIDVNKHYVPTSFLDKFAHILVEKVLTPMSDAFFKERWGCHAVMLETVAAIPGMVGGMLLHLRSLRKFEHSGGWIKALLEEAENERMHLMTFMEISQPVWHERLLVMVVQGVFFNGYFVLYVVSPQLAHRFAGYLEEVAVVSYTRYLAAIDRGEVENVPAPSIAIDYWRLPKDAKLRDVVIVVRADEAHHRDVQHFAADIRKQGKQLREAPAPVGYQ